MNLWPSRGLELHGFEIKVSRSDWLRELKDPAKAESIVTYCDRWWIAVGDAEIVKDGELPPTWGLLVPRGKGLIQKKEAPKLNAQPVDRCFLAGLLRRAMEQLVPEDQFKEAKRAEYDRGFENGRASNESRVTHAERDLAELNAAVEKFKEISGVTIDNWTIGNVADTVARITQADRRPQFLQRYESDLILCKGQVEVLTQLVDDLKKLERK